MLDSKEQSKRSVAKGFEKLVERESQKTDDDDVFRWDVAEAGRDTGRE
jgi:hypothetical protein